MADTREREDQVDVQIAISDEDLPRFGEVVDSLKAAGLQVDRTMEQLGLVTGSSAASKIATLARVKGVAGVERQRRVQLPPPDSRIQ